LRNPLRTIVVKMVSKVVVKRKRPDIKEFWPTKLQYLLKCCWSEDMNERPCFDIIIDVLDEILMYFFRCTMILKMVMWFINEMSKANRITSGAM